MRARKNLNYKNDDWYIGLNPEEKYTYDLIDKYHYYFSEKDKNYKRVVRIFKIVIMFFAMSNTVVLGLKTMIEINLQLVIGLVLSALVTFVSAVSSYFNFEEYWMRNISIHINLNILRDSFVFDAKGGKISTEIERYRNELSEIQRKNIAYWERSIKKIGIEG